MLPCGLGLVAGSLAPGSLAPGSVAAGDSDSSGIGVPEFDAARGDDEEHGQETDKESSAHGYLRIENQRAPTRRRSRRTTTT